MTVMIYGVSAHRLPGPVSFLDESAHRLDTSLIAEARQVSPSPWPRELGLRETQATPVLALAPSWEGRDRRWWDPRPRIVITTRARVMGGVRVHRFWRRAAAERRVQRFLDAHRRIYRLYAQVASSNPAPAPAARSGAL